MCALFSTRWGEGVNPPCFPSARVGQALAESLKTNGSLKELQLQNNNIGDCGAEALAAGLLQNRSLSSISLSRDYGYRLWGLWRTQGRKALEEAEKIKKERGEDFKIWWIPEVKPRRREWIPGLGCCNVDHPA